MDYPRFVRLRSPIWDAFEEALATARGRGRHLGHGELEEMAFRYRQVLHDHALAASRFPGTSAARRLRRLALVGTRFLMRDRGEGRPSLLRFFTRTFPQVFQRRLPMVGVAVALFAALAVLGLAVTALDPALGVTFVGQGAVEGLERGQLWTESLTTVAPPAATSSWIATNNVSVALTAWAGGAVAGLVTLYVVLLNGLMLGAVVGLTVHYGMAPALLEFVAAHGPLEITIILISAAGGLVLAWGLVAAEDRPRSEVLAEASRDALVILGGAAPWLVLLALVESFISPSPELPPAFKVGLGVALEVLFLTLAFRPMAGPGRLHG